MKFVRTQKEKQAEQEEGHQSRISRFGRIHIASRPRTWSTSFPFDVISPRSTLLWRSRQSISFEWLNSRVATLYMLAQVVVNGEVLLKWFNVFGRETPTCTEIKARFNVASPILIYAFDLQVAVLELNDTVKILQGEKVKDKKARNSRIPTDCKYVLIKMPFIPLCSELPFEYSSLRLFAPTFCNHFKLAFRVCTGGSGANSWRLPCIDL